MLSNWWQLAKAGKCTLAIGLTTVATVFVGLLVFAWLTYRDSIGWCSSMSEALNDGETLDSCIRAINHLSMDALPGAMMLWLTIAALCGGVAAVLSLLHR